MRVATITTMSEAFKYARLKVNDEREVNDEQPACVNIFNM